MSHKRMFSSTIIDTDAFIDMPDSSQLLYFHLAMRADDDGFVGSPKKIMRMCGFKEDDLKVLLSKRFILGFKSGVVVIKHWLIHNTIRKDRYSETTYIEEKKHLEIKKNKVYTEVGKPVGNQLATQYRIEKDRKEKNINIPFKKFWDLYQKKIDKHKCELKWKRLSDKEREDIIKNIPDYIRIYSDKKYRKNPLTYLNGKCWKDEINKTNNKNLLKERW